MSKLHTTFCILLCSFPIFSQNLKGKITSSQNQPLAAVQVRLLNHSVATLSAEDGSFELKNMPRGPQEVAFSLLGFAEKVVRVTSTTAPISVVLDEKTLALDEVVVAATKSETQVFRSPVSTTVLSAADVANYRIWNLQDLSGIAPNVVLQNPGEDRNVTSIRGIANPTYDQTAAVVIDGVVQFDNDTYLANLVDIEKIEVLRGPQTTLYGRNSSGGIIHISTRKPQRTSGLFETSIGNFGHYRYLGQFHWVGKTGFSAGLNVANEQRNGYFTNLFNNRPFDNLERRYVGAYAQYQVSSRFSLRLDAKWSLRRNDGSYPLVANDSIARANPWKVNLNELATDRDQTHNLALVAQYKGEKISWQSITAYQANTRFYTDTLDADFGPGSFANVVVRDQNGFNTVGVFTQEFRAQSIPKISAWNWLGGAYFFSQNAPEQQGLVSVLAAPLTLPSGRRLFPPFTTDTRTEGTRWGLSLYGQASYALQNWELTAGLRYDYEARDLTRTIEWFNRSVALEKQTGSQQFRPGGVVSPRVSAAWYPSEQTTVFASYTRGYRVGGLNEGIADPRYNQYEAEFSNHYELGLKKRLFQNRLQLSAAAFWIEQSDMQVATYVPGFQTLIQNAGALRSQGVELEVRAILAPGLRLDYGLGLTNARFKTLNLANPFRPQNDDLSNKKQIFTPDFNQNIAIQYDYSWLKNETRWSFFARVEHRTLGPQFFDYQNRIKQDTYSLLNAQVGISSAGFEATLWGRNLGEAVYLGYGYTFPGINPVTLGAPRTYGVTLRQRF
jgi:iron complex outermembrane recepter protein